MPLERRDRRGVVVHCEADHGALRQRQRPALGAAHQLVATLLLLRANRLLAANLLGRVDGPHVFFERGLHVRGLHLRLGPRRIGHVRRQQHAGNGDAERAGGGDHQQREHEQRASPTALGGVFEDHLRKPDAPGNEKPNAGAVFAERPDRAAHTVARGARAQQRPRPRRTGAHHDAERPARLAGRRACVRERGSSAISWPAGLRTRTAAGSRCCWPARSAGRGGPSRAA